MKDNINRTDTGGWSKNRIHFVPMGVGGDLFKRGLGGHLAYGYTYITEYEAARKELSLAVQLWFFGLRLVLWRDKF